MAGNANYLLKGTGYWVKILGNPHPGYTEGDKATAPKEWSFDLSLDQTGQEQAKRLGLAKKLRFKADDRGQFMSFRRKEFKGDNTTKNSPIKVVDHHNNPWDRSKLIGNGSILNVSFKIFEGKKGPKPVVMAVQVWDYKPYEGKSDFPTKGEEDWSEGSTQSSDTDDAQEMA